MRGAVDAGGGAAVNVAPPHVEQLAGGVLEATPAAYVAERGMAAVAAPPAGISHLSGP
jgi:hypothetical protein